AACPPRGPERPTIRAVRAIVLDAGGQPVLADVPAPGGPGAVARVLACGLCGSDVEKLDEAPAGSALGHEVGAEVARGRGAASVEREAARDLEDGRRVAAVHPLPCGECERCLAGHESTCERFAASTIRPGGVAEHRCADEVLSP